jgi:hypothetical protein
MSAAGPGLKTDSKSSAQSGGGPANTVGAADGIGSPLKKTLGLLETIIEEPTNSRMKGRDSIDVISVSMSDR